MAWRPRWVYFPSLGLYSLGDNQQDSPLTHLNLISYSNRGRHNSSELNARHPRSKISNQVKISRQPLHWLLSAHNKPPFTLWRHNERRREQGTPSLFFLCSRPVFAGRDPNSQLWCESRVGQHTGLHNLITCFIRSNLFLNQSGWGRKPSSWAGIYTAVLVPLMPPCLCGHVHTEIYPVCLDSFDIDSCSHLALTQETTCAQISFRRGYFVFFLCGIYESSWAEATECRFVWGGGYFEIWTFSTFHIWQITI